MIVPINLPGGVEGKQMCIRCIGCCLHVAFSIHSVLTVLEGIALNSKCCYVLVNYTLLYSTD